MADGQGAEAPAQDELDVDQLLSDLKEPQDARPMEGGEAPAEVPEAAPAEPWWSTFEFDHNGRKIKPDSEDKARTWMSQGYNYAQRAGELNAKEKAWLKEREELLPFKEKYTKYSQMEEYGAKNPEWLKHLHDSWNNRQVPQGLDPSIAQALGPIHEQLSQFQQYLEDAKAAKAQADADAAEARRLEEIEKQNEVLDQEIASIRKEFPKIDLSSKDESGKTLETRVYEHGVKVGTHSFATAFRDYLYPQLAAEAQAKGKETVVNDRAAQAKKGLLSTTSAPLKGMQAANNVRAKSWNDLAEEAKRDAGLI